MRKKLLSIFLILGICFLFTNTFAQNAESSRINAEAASAGSFNSTAISMVFWGVLLFAGMGVAAILIDSSTSHSSS